MNREKYKTYNDIFTSEETLQKSCHRRKLPPLQLSSSPCNKDLNRYSDLSRCDRFNTHSRRSTVEQNDNEPPPHSNYLPINQINDSKIETIYDDYPLGLPNAKFYCYMNSVIQALSHCIEFSNAVLSYRLDKDYMEEPGTNVDSKLISLFFQLMHDIGFRNKEYLNASSSAFQDIHDSFSEFADGEQDADEYLQFLLNKLNDVTKSKPKNKKLHPGANHMEAFQRFVENNDSFATRLFCGQMNNELYCLKCQFSKPSYQVFWVLPLPITLHEDQETTLESCLKAMLSKEKLDGKKCSKCRRENCVFTRIEITHWPIYFIIHLKRHIQSEYGYKTDVKIPWNINEHLVISLNTKYLLLGVIDHIGSTVSGHYIAKFRDLNDRDVWWYLNDMSVAKIVEPETEVITGNTTTYFFAKLNANDT